MRRARSQGDRVPRIGVLMVDENDPAGELRYSVFTQALAGLRWTDGRNARMDLRWHGGDGNRIRALAQETVGIVRVSRWRATVAAVEPVRMMSACKPTSFAGVADPVATGVVGRLDRPSGNITGFAILEATLGGKRLERQF